MKCSCANRAVNQLYKSSIKAPVKKLVLTVSAAVVVGRINKCLQFVQLTGKHTETQAGLSASNVVTQSYVSVIAVNAQVWQPLSCHLRFNLCLWDRWKINDNEDMPR
ncbi:unnamed protein product [Allacma fusca]|uniref:Uncharacterized protein n=1 Tax=Allacma fusca TaxID=39272 RepID=A0A8J2K7V6_9HEXA|nr:unnamed protein product [Allacma fusca]